ncbi:dyslexia-associated protein KIAA0319-like protein [Trichonephila clavipes]|nr:dyslexia-associated protein KIAA0319-like protein [Trichonephila clavipes]
MGPKKTLERIKYSFFWEGLRADVKKFCESCKECQLTRLVRIKDRSSNTPVARPELPFEVGNMDLIGPIDLPSLKGHKYILCLVDLHTRWGEAVPLTSLSAKVTCEAWLNIFSRTEIYLLSKREGFVEKNSAASWVTVLDLWKWYFCRCLTKGYATCVIPFDIYMTKKVRFKIEYTSYGCNLTAQVLRMLEQFVVSRIVDIDILMQIWKNRVKQINFVLEWVRWVGSEIIPAKGKLEPYCLPSQEKLRTDSSLLDVQVLSVDTVVCQNKCSGHGMCDPYTKHCVCEAFWMQDIFRYNFGDKESNCDWSILYVIIVSFTIVVTLAGVLWSVACCFSRRILHAPPTEAHASSSMTRCYQKG